LRNAANVLVRAAAAGTLSTMMALEPWRVFSVGLAFLGVYLTYLITEPAAFALGHALRRLVERLWH
jgi:uncharacterized membrane protein